MGIKVTCWWTAICPFFLSSRQRSSPTGACVLSYPSRVSIIYYCTLMGTAVLIKSLGSCFCCFFFFFFAGTAVVAFFFFCHAYRCTCVHTHRHAYFFPYVLQAHLFTEKLYKAVTKFHFNHSSVLKSGARAAHRLLQRQKQQLCMYVYSIGRTELPFQFSFMSHRIIGKVGTPPPPTPAR